MRPQDSEIADDITEQAQRWYLRLRDPCASAADQREFAVWFARSASHARAYEAARQLWDVLETPAQQLGAGGWYRTPKRRSQWSRPAMALAASIALMAVVFIWRDPGLTTRMAADHSTRPGVRSEVVLSDGSRVLLDVDSAIDASINDNSRNIVLLRGRAWFDVAHDAAHPFTVDAGIASVRVLGTSFAVQREAGITHVAVERGRVAVAKAGHTPDTELGRGEWAVVSADATQRGIGSEDALTAWRRGLLVFDRASLQSVADELSRAGAGRVVIVGKALRRRELSGVFRSDDPQAVLAAIESEMSVRTTTVPVLGLIIMHED